MAARLGILESTATDVLTRLRAAGLCHSTRQNKSSWVIGRDPRLRTVQTDRIGVRSAMRRRYEAGGEYTPVQMAALVGVPIAVAMTEISKMCSANDIVRAGPLDGHRENIRYRARPRPDKNVIRVIGFELGPGDRRDDCTRYEWCLDQSRASEPAHCKRACPGYQPVSRERLLEVATIRGRTQWSDA